MLSVRIAYRDALSQRYDALVDSGADLCVLDIEIAREIGIPLDGSLAREMGILGHRSLAFPVTVKILVGADAFETTVIFFEGLPMAGVLGRMGFFDNFTVTFDHSTKPPSFAYERIVRNQR